VFIARSPYTFGGFSGDRSKTPFSIVGVPLDATSSFRPGYRLAPLYIRLAAQNLEYFSMRFGVDLESVLYVDEGDIVVAHENIQRALEVVRMVSEYLFSLGRVPVFLGGEHTITYGTARAAGEYYKNVCVVVFDAHADLRSEYMGSRMSHACVVSRLVEVLGRDSVVLVGTRAVSREEYEKLREGRVRYVPTRTFRRLGLKHVAQVLSDYVSSCRAVYISVDMDVFDPAFAPGVATPEPDGLTPSDVLDLLPEILSSKFVALDVVEVVPPYDPSMVTSMLAAKVAIEFMSGLYSHLKP
jgi:agmatinase